MLYTAYQAQSDLMAPWRAMSAGTARLLTDLSPGGTDRWMVRSTLATSEIIARWGLSHRRPAFGIDSVTVEGREVAVREETVHTTPFGTLLRFRKDTDAVQPRVLLVAPLSGHFATLLRATVKTMLADHDVFITDWHNARDVPARHGRFGVDEYIDHVAGRPIEWFERNVIAIVPRRYAGAGRRVYPGFLQVAAFMRMNPDRHRAAFRRLYDDIISGNDARALQTKAFYDEYFAVLDLTAEFYLETVSTIFREHLLARGTFEYRGRRVDPAAIRRTSLLTVEGERDDICGVGQTAAA